MTLSRFPLLAILFLWAMFLSAATGSAKILAGEPAKNSTRDDPAPSSGTTADESQPTIENSATGQAAATYAYQIENYYYNSGNGWNWPGIVAGFSTGLVIFAAWQMWFVRRSAKATELAAEAVKKSAEAAASNVIATRELANLERPWIIVGKKSLIGFPLEESSIISPAQIEIAWELTNVGRSPGLITSISTVVVFAPLMDIPEPSYADDPLPAGELLIPPSGDYAKTSRKEISQEDFADFMARKRCVMFYGRIQYNDTSRRDPHVTRFCYRWYLENDQLLLDPVGPRNYVEHT